MNNEKREQARVLNSLCAQLEYAIKQRTDEDDSLNPDAIMLSTLVDGRDVRCIRAGAAALLREAEAAERAPCSVPRSDNQGPDCTQEQPPIVEQAEVAAAPDVSEAFEFQYCGNRYKLERTNTDEPWYTILVWRKERWEVKTTLSALVGAAIQAALRAARKREGEMVELLKGLDDAAEMLWATLANVSGGDWDKQSAEWRGYAEKWRDNYFVVLKQVLAFLAARETAALNEGAKNE